MKKGITALLTGLVVSLLIYYLSFYIASIAYAGTKTDYWLSETTRWLDIFRWLIPGLIVGILVKENVLLSGMVLGLLAFILTVIFSDLLLGTMKFSVNAQLPLALIFSGLTQEILKFVLATACGAYFGQRRLSEVQPVKE